MVLSRIRRSPEKTGGRDRRGSQGSLTPPGGSNRHSRSDSEPRTATPDRSDLFTTPKTPLRPLMESKSTEFVTPTSDSKQKRFIPFPFFLSFQLFVMFPDHQKSQNEDIVLNLFSKNCSRHRPIRHSQNLKLLIPKSGIHLSSSVSSYGSQG